MTFFQAVITATLAASFVRVERQFVDDKAPLPARIIAHGAAAFVSLPIIALWALVWVSSGVGSLR